MPDHQPKLRPPRPRRSPQPGHADPYEAFKVEIACTVLNVLRAEIQQAIEREANGGPSFQDMWGILDDLYRDVFDAGIAAVLRLDPGCAPQSRLTYGPIGPTAD